MDPNEVAGTSLIIQVILFLILGIIVLKKNRGYTINIYFSTIFFSICAVDFINILAILFYDIKWLYLIFIRLIGAMYLLPFFTFIAGFVIVVKGVKYFDENKGILKSIISMVVACLPVLIWPSGINYTPYFQGRYYIISIGLGSYVISLMLFTMILIFFYLPLKLWNWNKIMNLRIILFLFAMSLLAFSGITILLVGMRILSTNLFGIASIITLISLCVMLFNFLIPFEKRLASKQRENDTNKFTPKKLK